MADISPVNGEFIEEVGIVFERAGLPRMGGRVLGWLLICESSQQSAEQLSEALQASKGSISAMTRQLIHFGLIERFGIPGVRHDYFRLKADAWESLIRRGLSGEITIYRQLAEHGLKLMEDKAPEKRKWLEEMRDIYTFLEKEFPPLLEQWEKTRDNPRN